MGAVEKGAMVPNEAGRNIEAIWMGLPERFGGVVLDEFVVMPNHVHGIIILDRRGESCIRPDNRGDHKTQGDHKDRPYGTTPDSLGRIIQAFKSLTTNVYIRGVNDHGWPPFPGRLWQRNYYERIVRDEDELAGIRTYIRDNPGRWDEDAENPAKLP